ncbi:hypothetical protein [Burkholderia vietnamiensis]|uniref:hypothetical protein n=1 Tax=Burkholderia vietnamiensis TaxID=60552 RepID=UPI000B2BE870|nr:hypothetical protein [Burkholderia vietnamiensis]HDR9174435.1 hypothetical protein [Burkholderia vietnamiensis]
MSGNWVYHDGPVNPKPRFVVEYHRHAPENATIDALLARIPSRKRNAVMLEILRIAADTIARDPSLERRLGLAPGGPPVHPPPPAAPTAVPAPASAAPPAARAEPSLPPTVATSPTVHTAMPVPPATSTEEPPLAAEPPPASSELSPAAQALLLHGEDD